MYKTKGNTNHKGKKNHRNGREVAGGGGVVAVNTLPGSEALKSSEPGNLPHRGEECLWLCSDSLLSSPSSFASLAPRFPPQTRTWEPQEEAGTHTWSCRTESASDAC